MATAVALLSLCLLAGWLPSAKSSFPTIFPLKINNKEVVVNGFNLSSANRSIVAFEGIPYAEPPINALRFQPPRPLSEYPTLVDARHKQLMCPFRNKWGKVLGVENCLFLNVYVPQDAERGKDQLPVLVMLPGLGFSGRWRPHRIVDRRLVLVTVLSRNGALGFLTSNSSEAPGNVGLLDEALALKWVRTNIKNFCGDPNRITLGGVGVGAEAVQLHMLSTKSRGDFHRTIAISGSALSPWAVTANVGEALNLTKRLAENIGCNCSHVNLTKIVGCLRNKPFVDIVRGTEHLQGWLGLPPSPFQPVVDGSFLPETPRSLWEAGRVDRVPMLVGLARGEGLRISDYDAKDLLGNDTLLEELRRDWSRLAPQLLAFNSSSQSLEMVSRLREHYLGDFWNSSMLSSAAREALLRLLADRHVLLPALRGLTLHSTAYLYLYSWAGTPADKQWTSPPTSPLNGPEGGTDAELIFMEPDANEKNSNPKLRAMIDDILDLWASFITNGKPSTGNTTLNSSLLDSGEDLRALNLTGPGQRETSVLAIKGNLLFWDSIHLPAADRTEDPTKRDSKPTTSVPEHTVSSSSHWPGSYALCLTLAAGAMRFVQMRCLCV